MNGILLVDKPVGWTSHDVVAKVRSILRTAHSTQPIAPSKEKLGTKDYGLGTPSPKVKVGHAGTLDPAATGLLIVLVGSYTKRAAEFSKLDKTYEAEVTLGATSSTGDSEGEITVDRRQKTVDREKPTKEVVEAVLGSFLGEIMQTPHAYSAVKVGGQRAYKAARAGKTVEIEPRKVTIYQLQTTNYRYPKLCITARVSSGTYIRSLAEDIGQKLSTGAYLSALRRTKVGQFSLTEAFEIHNINFELITSYLKTIAN